MLHRLLHSAITLVAIIVAYQLYDLSVVPWLEPPLLPRSTRQVSEDDREQASNAITKYQQLLGAYFPAGHWSLARPPKVIESGPVMLVLDDYERHDDGRVDLSHFAVLIFPTPRQESATPPRDAIILEAPQGARLQFDKNFRPERGQIGQIIHGEFPGRITIHSDMQSPGPDDDLLIETSDLAMNSKLLFSPSEVRFRMGPNVGGGRELEIRLLADEQSDSHHGGLKIAGVESLEIRRDVRLRAFLGTPSLIPGEKPHNTDNTADDGSHAERGNEDVQLAAAIEPIDATKPPVELTCTGPFRFDFLSYVASFDSDVEVLQVNPEGPSDQLSCQQLDIHFAPKADAAEGAAPSLAASRQQRQDLGRLRPDKLVAQGYPVIVVSPSRQAEVRGTRVQLMLDQRQVKIDGGQEATLSYGPNVLRAPVIEYQHPAADANTRIGSFHADGPGTLRYVPDPSKPDQIFQAAWQASVELGRLNGQPVLTVAGRPKLVVTDMGQLTADQIRVYLREVEQDGKTKPIPERMNAVGQVEIDSPGLLARTRELVAMFHVESPAEAVASSGIAAMPGANEVVPGANPAASNANTTTSADRFNMARSAGPAARVYQMQSDSIQLDVALEGRRAAPNSLTCNGNVAFRELPSSAAGQQPFEVRGGQLTADQLATAVHITIHGNALNEAPGGQMAQIDARGLSVRAPDIQLDEAQNHLWIVGPGTATLAVTRDLSGHETTTPHPVEIHWQGGLNFDGRTVVVQQNILVVGADDTLRCDELAGTLTAPIEFGKRVDQNNIDLAEVECRGNVQLDHKSRDAVDITSHERMELSRLSINQQSGAISGDGPGVIRSTHFAAEINALATPAAANPAAAQPAAAPKKTQLHFLRVDFQRGLTGNLILRNIEFDQRVRAVYGPVDSWEQELDLDRPETILPGAMTLTSDRLRINEDPMAAARDTARGELSKRALGKVQMRAEGNVRIEGESPTQGRFEATAEHAAYEQTKELFTLEGGRTPAWIRYQTVGQQHLEQYAQRIQHNRLTNRPTVDGVQYFEFTPAGASSPPPQNALGPAPLRQ